MGACGGEVRYSVAELEDMTRCEGGTVFTGRRQADRHASYTRACVSPYGKLRLNEFADGAARDAYVGGEVFNPLTGRKPEYAFFVLGDGWAVACESRAAQREVADVTGGETAP